MIKKTDIADICFLTPMQEGMLFHYLLDKKSPAYFEQVAYRIYGQLDHKPFEEAFFRIIEKYDVLRTIFVFEKVSRPMQVVLKKREATVYYDDITKVSADLRENLIKEFKNNDKAKGFDLSKDILLRLAIFKISDNQYEIVWSFHHIILDGWCITILIEDMLLAYHSLKEGKTVNLPPAVPYSNYIKWIEKQDKEVGINYWKSYLEDYERHVNIPHTITVRKNQFEQKTHQFIIESFLFSQLEKISVANNITISTIFQTLWGILLQKYNDTHDAVFGSVVSGRPAELEGITRMVGLFINTIPVRIKSEPSETTVKLLKKVQIQMLQSQSYTFVPLAEIQSNSPLKRNTINHIVIIENFPVDTQIKNLVTGNDLALSIENVEVFEQTNYDLDVIVSLAGELRILLKYNAMVYNDYTIKRIKQHMVRIIKQININQSIPVKEIEIIATAEKMQLLFNFNRTDAEYPKNKTIQQLFEEQVEKTPNHIAVLTPYALALHNSSLQISYKELNKKSNQLSRLLRQTGTPPQSIVCIMAERSIKLIISILGVLKSGGAYLPIDSSYPESRKQFILKDSGSRILLADKHFSQVEQDTLTSLSINYIRYSECMDFHLNTGALENPDITINPDDMAYIIYTSGTTGNPKGVIVRHRGVVDYVWWAAKNYVRNEKINFPLYTSISFDLTVTSIFTPLMTGNSIVVYPDKKNDFLLEEIINDRQVEIIKLTPSHLKLVKYKKMKKGTIIKRIIVGGEELETMLAEDIFHIFNGKIEIYNEYGPTETVVGSMIYKFIPGLNNNRTVLIGVPADNTRIYILDKNLHVLPIGVTGEIHIAGVGVAMGYLNRPDLTAEKFLANPFENCSMMYKTGDLAMWMPDGNIEFLGRVDNQVKIRGYRIELGEIESQLMTHEDIKEAVIMVTGGTGVSESSSMEYMNEDKQLCVYIISNREFTILELKEFLAKKLPDYMIPSYFHRVEKIPLTQSGKIDTRALNILSKTLDMGNEYAPPESNLEKIIAAVWKEILGIDYIGLHDNFFDLGGNSLKVIRLLGKLNKLLDVNVNIVELFEFATIGSLAEHLAKKEKEGIIPEQSIERAETMDNAKKSRLDRKMKRRGGNTIA